MMKVAGLALPFFGLIFLGYRARAHALKLFLSGFDYGEEFDRLANTFTPDTVDFSKTPAHPGDQVVKAVEKIAGLRRTGGN